MIVLIILLLTSSLAFAQPYEPIILLDVRGEIDNGLGVGFLSSLGDLNEDGRDDILTTYSQPTGGGTPVIFWVN
jgi:hypothetical protein